MLLDILTGLRVSELLALKWSDVDFENLEVHVTRSIALQRVRPLQDGKRRRSPFRSIPSWPRLC